jgi:putative acetyltransferase
MEWTVRQATASDAEGIAEAHVDSIRSLGPGHYPPEAIDIWGRPRDLAGYLANIADGSMFVAESGRGDILGFSSHRIYDGQHRIGLYVRGSAARNGIGSALYRAAEEAAVREQAATIHLSASLVAAPFYAAKGFVEEGRGQHTFRSGGSMACVFMIKKLI